MDARYGATMEGVIRIAVIAMLSIRLLIVELMRVERRGLMAQRTLLITQSRLLNGTRGNRENPLALRNTPQRPPEKGKGRDECRKAE